VFENFQDAWPTPFGRVTRDIMRNMLGGMTGPILEEGDLYLTPRVDFYRKDGKLFVEAELPGVNPEEVDLQVYSDRLSFSAEKRSESRKEKEEQSYIHSERFYGKMERIVIFPVEVNPDTAKASFKHGVLIVEIAENTKPLEYKKVSISSEE
jgi:HSP20 family protein